MKMFMRKALLLGLLAAVGGTQAEDVDLFVGTPPSVADIPNVLIVLDNTANWNTPFSNEMAALSSVVSALPADKFRVGLMMFSETGGGNSGNDGAYVRAAIRQLSALNKPLYQSLVNNLDVRDDKSNGGKISKAMEEAYLYFSAGTPHAGNNKNKTDFIGNSGVNTSSDAIYALPANALSVKAGTTYNNPILSGCAKNFVIYISNGAAQDNNSDITQATAALAAAGGATTTIAISPSGSQRNVADEWARFMKKSALGITTYTLDINKVTTGQGPGWTALLKSMARVSSGKYFDVTSTGTQVADALLGIFSEIQAVNSVFASVSLPVSVNTQGTFLNQVYVGMFRPDSSSLPRWPGNLKQYKLGLTDGVLKLQDADSAAAINPATGFVTACARSFWTPTAADTYWAFSPRGSCLTVGSENSNSPDGNIVEKGAQAYMLRAVPTASTRSMKTCSPVFATCAGTSALSAFDTANTAITSALLGVANTTERSDLINWVRGQDLKLDGAGLGEEDGDTNTAENRPSIHGDVVHSRPVAINHGTDAAPQVVVYYGGNDGSLRAVNGNRTASIGSFAAGSELWSFVPPEFYANLKRLYDNVISISFPDRLPVLAGEPTPQPKAYGFDGPLVALKEGSDSWIYASMRRGGRALYAFDVSAPTAPTLKWKKGCPNPLNDTDCSLGFSGIGQTWSPPRTLKAAGYSGGTASLLIMGGGYDACEDADPNTCSSPKGNHVYVLDADTGALLKTFDTERSVVADISVVPDSSGLAIYAYVADMGGNVYRVAMGAAAPADWTMTQIADLGCDTPASCSANRKFMFAPDVVADAGGYVLMLGSGDREKPLSNYSTAYGVTNYFFMLKDRPGDATWLTTEAATNCGGAAVLCKASLLGVTTASTPTNADLALKKGWYLDLSAHEQVVTSAITVFGVVTFSTHQPAVATPGLCSNLGEARVYNVSYLNAEGQDGERYALLAGGGLPPSPVAGMVTLDDGSLVPFIIGANPDSPLEGSPPTAPPLVSQPAARVYWNIEQ